MAFPAPALAALQIKPPTRLDSSGVLAMINGMQAAPPQADPALQGFRMPERGPAGALASFAPPGQRPASPSSGPSGRTEIGRQIYDHFISQGLQPHQAAAIAGNMAWEGGGRTDLVNPDDNYRNSPRSPHSIGIGQWNDRAPALIAFARQQGIELPEGDMRDVGYMREVARRIPLQTQLQFAWSEMQGPEGRAYRGIRDAPDLRGATAGAISYHRPAGWSWSNPYGGHGFDGRYSLAQQILNSAGAR